MSITGSYPLFLQDHSSHKSIFSSLSHQSSDLENNHNFFKNIFKLIIGVASKVASLSHHYNDSRNDQIFPK